MANVSRSSSAMQNVNRLRVHRTKIYLQSFPGTFANGEEASAFKDIEYALYINDNFSQSGMVPNDGCIELLVPGASKAELEVLGTKYDIEVLPKFAAHDSILGVKQRLRSLGYYQAEINGKWCDELDKAVLNFQADYMLEVSGDALDQKTIDALKTEVGE